MAEPIYDNAEDLRIVQDLLLPGEALEALFDLRYPSDRQENPDKASNRYLAITSRRLIHTNHAFGEGSTRRDRSWMSDDARDGDPLSVPYRSVIEVALIQKTRVYVSAAETRTLPFGFRDAARARQAHDRILSHLL